MDNFGRTINSKTNTIQIKNTDYVKNGIASVEIDMKDNKIINLAKPTNDKDVVNKEYLTGKLINPTVITGPTNVSFTGRTFTKIADVNIPNNRKYLVIIKGRLADNLPTGSSFGFGITSTPADEKLTWSTVTGKRTSFFTIGLYSGNKIFTMYFDNSGTFNLANVEFYII